MTSSPYEFRLTPIDRKILKVLLKPDSKIKSHTTAEDLSNTIASKLRISPSLVNQRREIFETNFLDMSYVMDVTKFGYKRVDFFIATQKGLAVTIANKLLKMKNIVSVGHSIGEPTIDLRVELIVKDNGELLEYLEQIKGINGVRDVIWSEIVKIIGIKGTVPSHIIDSLE